MTTWETIKFFIKEYKKALKVNAEMPKSVSAMTRLMEPQIMRDFPEFSWEEFKQKAENMSSDDEQSNDTDARKQCELYGDDKLREDTEGKL